MGCTQEILEESVSKSPFSPVAPSESGDQKCRKRKEYRYWNQQIRLESWLPHLLDMDSEQNAQSELFFLYMQNGNDYTPQDDAKHLVHAGSSSVPIDGKEPMGQGRLTQNNERSFQHSVF